ncbi:hypothetical protein ABT282_08655 [Streptomyces sp. NPDC000927]|uniref:hypothetical protein n=1 Tax=Streptomyces sp. NPDC000927 TaxID=3154371 RepID=UPI003323308F
MITDLRTQDNGTEIPVSTATTTVTMNTMIVSSLTWKMAPKHVLAATLRWENILVKESCEPGRYNATVTVDEVLLGVLERELIALREEYANLGFTSGRVKFGFNAYAMDAAMSEVRAARWELTEGMAA